MTISPDSLNSNITQLLRLGVSSILFGYFWWVEQQKKQIPNSSNVKTNNTALKEYFKLPSNVNIHVIKDADEADRLLYNLYNSILSDLGLPLVNNDSLDGATTTNTNSNSSNEPTTTTNSNDNSDSDSDSSTSSLSNIKILNETGLSIEATDKVVLGLDAEWAHDNLHQLNDTQRDALKSKVKSSSPRVALIQISNATDAYLLQVAHMSHIPKALTMILTDPRLLKVGVAINQDATTIFKNFGILTKGCVDLVPLARLTNYNGNGLASLAYSTLNVNVDKSHHVRCSHWELEQLSNEQIHYAACDAWISHAIYTKMLSTYRSRVIPGEPIPTSLDFCRPFINANFKIHDKPSTSSSNVAKSAGKNNQAMAHKSTTHIGRDDRVLYDNCPMYGPDDTLLCNVSKKKVQWYVDRGLGEITCQDPLTVKLTFTPKGNGHADDAYYLSNKENRCVVCGTTKKILRHSIVPHSYRQYLPIDIKSHSSHDVVILCSECHFTMNKRLHFMKLMIADQYDVPFENNNSVIVDKDLLRMSKHAIVLFGHFFKNQSKYSAQPPQTESNDNSNNDNNEDETSTSKCNNNNSGLRKLLSKKSPIVPTEKIEVMKTEVLEYLGKSELLEDDVIRLVQSNPKHKREDYVAHEKLVMDKVLSEGDAGIKKFIRTWRKNFVETVQPKFLNEHWSIDK